MRCFTPRSEKKYRTVETLNLINFALRLSNLVGLGKKLYFYTR